MNEPSERAIVQTLLAYPPLTDLVDDRVTWDDQEIDLEFPSVTLRLLSTRMPAAGFEGRGGVRQCLVEASAHAVSSGSASILADLVIAALTPYDGLQSVVFLTGGGEVRFGGIMLNDLQQSQTQPRSYRKAATFTVSLYE